MPCATFDVLIVGAGHGGSQTAISLRRNGYSGSLALLGDETEPPYERPPLSKAYLAGEKGFERILIRPIDFWAEREVALLGGRRVVAVDAEAHVVTTSGGERIGYRSLVWSAGGRARRLACRGGDLAGVHTVRSKGDVDRMAIELPEADTVVVIGGGYIGLEAAAVLTKLGKRVVLLEAADRVLSRVAGTALARFFEDEHRAQGVDIRLGATVDRILGEDRATGVRLSDGRILHCDMVVVGIGILPEAEQLTTAGASGTNGVDVDEDCRTSLADVFAIGDCARRPNLFSRRCPVGLESVQNATHQAETVAAALTGRPRGADPVPWFWSDQYDLKLQTVGLSMDHDRTVLRGRPEDRRFSVVYLRDDRVVALDCVNRPRDFMQGRALIEAGGAVDLDRLADSTIELKSLLRT